MTVTAVSEPFEALIHDRVILQRLHGACPSNGCPKSACTHSVVFRVYRSNSNQTVDIYHEGCIRDYAIPTPHRTLYLVDDVLQKILHDRHPVVHWKLQLMLAIAIEEESGLVGVSPNWAYRENHLQEAITSAVDPLVDLGNGATQPVISPFPSGVDLATCSAAQSLKWQEWMRGEQRFWMLTVSDTLDHSTEVPDQAWVQDFCSDLQQLNGPVLDLIPQALASEISEPVSDNWARILAATSDASPSSIEYGALATILEIVRHPLSPTLPVTLPTFGADPGPPPASQLNATATAFAPMHRIGDLKTLKIDLNSPSTRFNIRIMGFSNFLTSLLEDENVRRLGHDVPAVELVLKFGKKLVDNKTITDLDQEEFEDTMRQRLPDLMRTLKSLEEHRKKVRESL